MNVVVERCAFLDVHSDTVMACARMPDGDGGRREEVTDFGTTTSQLLLTRDVARQLQGTGFPPVSWDRVPGCGGGGVMFALRTVGRGAPLDPSLGADNASTLALARRQALGSHDGRCVC